MQTSSRPGTDVDVDVSPRTRAGQPSSGPRSVRRRRWAWNSGPQGEADGDRAQRSSRCLAKSTANVSTHVRLRFDTCGLRRSCRRRRKAQSADAHAFHQRPTDAMPIHAYGARSEIGDCGTFPILTNRSPRTSVWRWDIAGGRRCSQETSHRQRSVPPPNRRLGLLRM
jgi:hypothetical protein